MRTNTKDARTKGFGYLIITLAGAFAKVFIRLNLIVAGDSPSKTKMNMVSEWLFRRDSASDLIILMCDAMVALTLYVLLKPVNRVLFLLAAFFRLMHTAIHGINLLYRFLAMQPTGGTDNVNICEPDRLHSIPLKTFPDLHRQILMG